MVSEPQTSPPNSERRWRLIETWACCPALAMGLDEVLLESIDTRPTLRLYTWVPAALSLGYFQRFADIPAAREVPHVVRRITGGGAIHHHSGELTFSIAAPAYDPLYRGEVAASYARVHAVLIEALVAVGLAGEHTPTLAEARGALRSDLASTGMCFHASTPLDIVWDGRKGVGSAQRRSGGRVLHHGSIKLAPSPHEPEVATAAAAGVLLTPREFAPALTAAFTQALGITLAREAPTATELARAEALGARYAAADFVHRR